MATELIMPTLPAQTPHHHFYPPPERPHHTRSHSYQPTPSTSAYPQLSPLSTLSSANASPTSPKSYLSRQQNRGPAAYIPAVLRPTEFTSKTGPPSRATRSPQGDEASSLDGDPDRTLRRSSNSFMSLPGLTVLGQRLSRRSTGDSGKYVDDDWDLEMFPRVNGLPTRKHWKPDPEAAICEDPTCKRTFSYFTRRHHCRKCGNIFCDSHSAFAIPLDQDCNFNPRGSPSRSCSHCYSEFRAWKSRAGSQVGSASSSDAAGAAGPSTNTNTPASPIAAGGSPVGGSVNGSTNIGNARGPAEVAASVPRDWNWSTF